MPFRDEGDIAIAYLSLSICPLEKGPSTTNGHLCAIGYFRKLRSGQNPLLSMNRLQLMINGMKRANGPTARKLPTAVEDLRSLKGLLDLNDIYQRI